VANESVFRTQVGEGFGIGGFGGIDEQFGSVGSEFFISESEKAIVITNERTGGVILGEIYQMQSGVISFDRTDHVDSSGIILKSNRNLIFE